MEDMPYRKSRTIRKSRPDSDRRYRAFTRANIPATRNENDQDDHHVLLRVTRFPGLAPARLLADSYRWPPPWRIYGR